MHCLRQHLRQSKRTCRAIAYALGNLMRVKRSCAYFNLRERATLAGSIEDWCGCGGLLLFRSRILPPTNARTVLPDAQRMWEDSTCPVAGGSRRLVNRIELPGLRLTLAQGTVDNLVSLQYMGQK